MVLWVHVCSYSPFCNVQIDLFAVQPSLLQEEEIILLFELASQTITKEPEVLAVMSSLNGEQRDAKVPK